MGQIVDPEPWIRAKVDEELRPLREQLAAAQTPRERRRIRWQMLQAERKIRRTFRSGPVAW